jgi:glyoxylase-like metal-dependent hydrolase (beta-lactamase superfamily II)
MWMKSKRLVMFSLFAALAGLAVFVTGTEAQPGTLKQVLPGVWFREGEIKEMGHSNNVIIEMKDYLVVVDANFPSGAHAVIADMKKVSPKPVKYVFITHHHGDHIYGIPVWTKLGATTIAYKAVNEELKKYEPKRWREAQGRKDIAELKLSSPEPVQQSFEKIPYVIDDGSRRVEFWHFGWAHTRGDSFAYLPKEQALVTGDAIVDGAYNYTGDGHISNWPNVIRAARTKLKVKQVLPGHGGPGGPSMMTGQEQFFLELLKGVKSAMAQNKKLEDIVQMQGEKAVSTSIKLPASVNNWVGGSLPNQVKETYEELKAGRPHGEIAVGK